MIERVLAGLRARIAGVVTRGVITLVNDGLETQTLQVTLRKNSPADDVEHMQPYGVSFRPEAGSECIVFAVGAAQDHLVTLGATKRGSRPTDVEEGEGGLYTKTGWKVFCDVDGNVFLTSKDARYQLSRADKVDEQFRNVQISFESVGGTPAEVVKPYVFTGTTGADKVWGE